MSSAREFAGEPDGRELPGRLVADLGLAALVLAGHVLGGGVLTLAGLPLLAGATLAVTTLARRLPQLSAGGYVVLLIVAQAVGHLALAFGGGAAAHPAVGRMLLGHAVSTAAVAALTRHGRLCWRRVGQLLSQALRVWAVLACSPPREEEAGRARHADDDRGPARTPAKGAVARRGPPGGGGVLARSSPSGRFPTCTIVSAVPAWSPSSA